MVLAVYCVVMMVDISRILVKIARQASIKGKHDRVLGAGSNSDANSR
jgi:hypothetical protein